ncbi:tRNA (adenine(58)-N(1))-methyltransferase non-catalytic subunit trm6 [Entomophthora muscae]|uniref:tRNA (Adenine(58)-N(1))-methyltransferase non-catalytic subunit trm6 n=1 Tax=Entomophthora muscae TaxID=34485 RepID=A0ACC2TK85_9FUNG|nr:tRNA (adenine(58)-N(1))-methyltransferase non-catalytic subunit trm6 [Entomophthora muscae]
MDTLSQLLTFGNVFPGCRLLVVDDTQGLVVASILERLGGVGEAICIHETEFANYDIVRFFNFNPAIVKPMFTIRWDKLQSDYVASPREEVDGEVDSEKALKRRQAQKAFQDKRDEILKGGFDGLIIASSTTHPLGILEALAPLVAPSRQVVMYSMYKEPLLETLLKMREASCFLNPTITDCWLRQYQVLPGRSHPDMSSPGASGFLLTTTTILDRGDATPISSKVINPATKKARLDKEELETAL